MTKALAALLAAALLALAGVGIIAKHQAAQIGALRSENATLSAAVKTAAKAREADLAVLARRAAENAATARETASARASLSDAMAQHRQWADEPVPEEVQKALR